MKSAKERNQVDRVVLANGSKLDDWKVDVHFIEGATVDKDTMHLSVSYSGGCAEHKFRLVAWNYFSTAHDIVQAELLLAHDSNNDACKAIVKDELRFDISPLKAEYHRLYDPRPSTVLLGLGSLSIEYYV